MQSLDAVLDHSLNTTYDDLPPTVIEASKSIVLDCYACAFAGSSAPEAQALYTTVSRQFGTGDVPVLGSTYRLSPIAAGMVNGCQVHCLEYASVHERATVHPLSVIFPTLLSLASTKKAVSGREFITALNVSVDVACLLGLAAKQGATFFRPGVCGALGAAAGAARLAKFNRAQACDLFGLTYSQLSGTMQAHTEASMALGLQIAFSVRNVLTAVDFVQAGLSGPHDILDGRFGYFALFEPKGEPTPWLDTLGRDWRMPELSYKPFPSGRASHGAIDAVRHLRNDHKFEVDDVDKVVCRVPPFVHRLAGRPIKPNMDAAYARLCLPFLVASLLIDGSIDVRTYRAEALTSPKVQNMGKRVLVEIGDNTDVNALSPQEISVTLKSGQVLACAVPALLGHPDNPMSDGQHREKLLNACETALAPVSRDTADTLAQKIAKLEDLPDITGLADRPMADRA